MGETVTISREEYDSLLAQRDELADILAVDRTRAALERGDEELIPAEFANRIIDGENPVRVFRELRGLTISALAAKAGVNRVQLSTLESGRRSASVDTYRKLADALGVTVDDVLP